MNKLIKTISILFLLILVLLIVYHVKYSTINKEFTTGGYFGFKIGLSKEECYTIASELIIDNKLIGFNDIYYDGFNFNSKNKADIIYSKDICLWNYWIIENVNGVYNRIDIEIKSDTIIEIRGVKKGSFDKLTCWKYTIDTLIEFDIGDSCNATGHKFEELNRRGLKNIFPPNLSKFNFPNDLNNNNFHLLNDFHVFDFKISNDIFVNNLRLHFDNGDKLIKIERLRQAFELP